MLRNMRPIVCRSLEIGLQTLNLAGECIKRCPTKSAKFRKFAAEVWVAGLFGWTKTCHRQPIRWQKSQIETFQCRSHARHKPAEACNSSLKLHLRSIEASHRHHRDAELVGHHAIWLRPQRDGRWPLRVFSSYAWSFEWLERPFALPDAWRRGRFQTSDVVPA